jgi:hypothetical protein
VCDRTGVYVFFLVHVSLAGIIMGACYKFKKKEKELEGTK